ncbi:MAG: cold shock domain-containing protein, partial [Bacteroidales bacterium]|nr:cold shock domain-containing protein [Bacteroidales bacterium]
DSKKEYFVHATGLVDEIQEGDTVEFDGTEGKKGLNAINVKVA